jgi:hypothetical protein
VPPGADLGERFLVERDRVVEDQFPVAALGDAHAANDRQARDRAHHGPQVVVDLLDRFVRRDRPGARRFGHGTSLV